MQKMNLDPSMDWKTIQIELFSIINTHPSLCKNFLKEKSQSGNFEPSTSDESRNKSLHTGCLIAKSPIWLSYYK